jgi:tetratricopeptide (TPR) repeat protein
LFAHALIRKTLHDRLGPGLRMDLHLRVAETLEALGRADADPAELARHWVAAIPSSGAAVQDAVRAAHAAQRAARLAMAGLAYEEAITHFEGALKAARQNNDRRWVCQLLIELGEAQRCAGDSAHRSTLLAAGAMAHELHDVARVARAALANQRGVYSRIGDVDVDRVGALQTALGDLGPGDLSLRANLLSALATEVHFGGDQRLELASEALDLAWKAGSAETVAHALSALWFAAWGLVPDAERGAIASKLHSVASDLTDRSLRFQASVCVFLSATGSGNISRADDALANCERLAEELGQPVLRWRVSSLRVHRAIISGDFDRAETLAQQSLALGELTGQPDRVPFTITPTASIRLLQGRSAEVEAMVTPMLEQFPGVLAFRALLAWALADTGRAEEAAAILLRLRPGGFAGIPRDYGWLFYTSCLSRACYHIGDAGSAAELYELLLTSRGSMATTQASWIGPVTHDMALLASTLGRHKLAESHFAEAAEFQDLIGARGTGLHTRLEWARMLVRLGGRTRARRARTILLRALAQAQEASLPFIEARILELLQEVDATCHPG